MTRKQIIVDGAAGRGTLYFQSKSRPRVTGASVEPLGHGEYKVIVEGNQRIVVKT